jgi:quercetin dioxygenase-like cupin family protein
MTSSKIGGAPQEQPLPPDDPNRRLTHVHADNADLEHVHLVGDTYTYLVTGRDTYGAYCLIDMHVPACGGPNPHRHEFEEMFYLLEGEVELTFRGETRRVKAGETVNIPANAPHFFKNKSGATTRMLCMCTPAGQEDFFREMGTRAANRIDPAPELSKEDMKAFGEKAQQLGLVYRTEFMPPDK